MSKSVLLRVVLAALLLCAMGTGAASGLGAAADTTAGSVAAQSDTLAGAAELAPVSDDTLSAVADTSGAEAGGAPAGGEAVRTYQAAEVTVTATKLNTTLAETPADVTIIGRQEIEANEEKNLIDLLGRKEGVNPGSYGSYGALELISLRGARSGRVPVTLDGVPLNNAQNGDVDLNTVPSSFVDRIEIVRGPLGSLNGGNGIAGVVNLVTVEPVTGNTPVSLVATSSGSLAYRKHIANFGRRLGRIGMILGIEDSGTDGTPPYKDYSGRSFYGKLSCNLAARSRVEALLMDYSGTLKTLASAVQKTEVTRVQVTGTAPLRDAKLKFGVYGSDEDTRYSDPYSWTNSDLEKYGATVDASMEGTSLGDVVYGGGFARNGLTSKDAATSWSPTTREGYVFGGARLNSGTWLKSLVSVRADFHSDYGSELSPYGSIWHELPNGMVWLSFGRGFNPPTLNDLFWPTQTMAFGGWKYVTRGNRGLSGETSWMGEVGSRLSFFDGVLRGGATGFASRTEDFITWASSVSYADSTVTYTPENSDQVDALGAELSLEAFRKGNPVAGANLTLQRVEDESGAKVPYMPETRLNLWFVHGVEPFPDLDIRLEVNATHVGTYSEPLGSTQGPYFLLEGRLSGSIAGFTAFVRLRNATDQVYPSRSLMSLEEGRPAAYYPMPERNYEIGLLWRLFD